MARKSASAVKTTRIGRAKADALRELRTIPGVGPSIAGDLWELDVTCVEDLRGADPEALYVRHCGAKGAQVDRCWLYVARCAVYFASRQRHDPEKLKWWNWKDRG